MAQNQHGAGKTAEGKDEKLTGATNRQEFPARVQDDAAQEDNRRRVAAVKERDAAREMLPEQRQAAEDQKVRTLTGPGGTKVTASDEQTLAGLKASGYK